MEKENALLITIILKYIYRIDPGSTNLLHLVPVNTGIFYIKLQTKNLMTGWNFTDFLKHQISQISITDQIATRSIFFYPA